MSIESFSEEKRLAQQETAELTRERVVEDLRTKPDDFSPLKKYLNREEEKIPKSKPANFAFFELAVQQTDIYREAGLRQAATDSFETNMMIADQLGVN